MDQAYELKTCPHCGAGNRQDARACWLCGWSPQQARTGARPTLSANRGGVENAAAILLGVLLLVVGWGVFGQARGLGIVLLVLVAPALLALGITMTREQRLRPSFAGFFAAFMVSGMGLVFVLTLVAAASSSALLIACFVVCAFALGGG
jgi:hypothetical protein